MDKNLDINKIKKLRKWLIFYQISTFLLAGILMFFAAKYVFNWSLEYLVGEDLSVKYEKPPYYDEIKKIMNPLRYSGIPSLLNNELRIDIDFENKKWYIRNIFGYDSEGNILLEKGQYGLCGELAAYTYQKIRPLFDRDRYVIKFLYAVESEYFASPSSSHIILQVRDKKTNHVYLIDPSFRKYGKMDSGKFDNYLFIQELENLDFMQHKSADRSFGIGVGSPIVIRNEFLVGLIVEKSADKFDKDNFIIAVTATHRNRFGGRYILALRRHNGQLGVIENRLLGRLILGNKDHSLLEKKVKQWFEEISRPGLEKRP